MEPLSEKILNTVSKKNLKYRNHSSALAIRNSDYGLYFPFPQVSVDDVANVLMLKKWENTVDNRKLFGAILRDLPKSFYYNSHELVIVNLNWYEINWYERTEINILCSSWEEILS